MPAKLSVNLNAIAMLRNRRDLPWPSVTGLGRLALAAGAHGLTVHPRPDERHTRHSDLPELRALIDDEFPKAEFNIEGYPTEDFLALVEKHQPEQVTLVPDDPAQATSDHGWNFAAEATFLIPIVKRLKKGGFASLFSDPDPDCAAAARDRRRPHRTLYGAYGSYHSDSAKAQRAGNGKNRRRRACRRTAGQWKPCGGNLPGLPGAFRHGRVSIDMGRQPTR
jgi:pyridoxine 5-phosphate synthase